MSAHSCGWLQSSSQNMDGHRVPSTRARWCQGVLEHNWVPAERWEAAQCVHICALHKLGTHHICDIPVGTHSSCRGCPDGRPRRLQFSPVPFQGSALLSAAVQRCHPIGGVLCLEPAKGSSGSQRLLLVPVQQVWRWALSDKQANLCPFGRKWRYWSQSK